MSRPFTKTTPLTDRQRELAVGFLESHGAWLYNLIKKLSWHTTGKQFGRTDMEQEATIVLFRLTQNYKEGVCPFNAYVMKWMPRELTRRVISAFDPVIAQLPLDCHECPAPEIQMDFLELDRVREAMKSLPVRDRFILQRRFGIKSRPLTLKEVGLRLGLTEERVRQLQNSALEKLRCKLSSTSSSSGSPIRSAQGRSVVRRVR